MSIKPLADRVLIQPAAAEEKSAGGIILPDSAKEKPLQGKVIATGNGTKDEEMVVKAGDTEFGDAPGRCRTFPAGQDHDSDSRFTGTDDPGAILCTEFFQFISRAVIIDAAVCKGAVNIQNNVFNHMPAPWDSVCPPYFS